jgi:hypothetical protein
LSAAWRDSSLHSPRQSSCRKAVSKYESGHEPNG